MNNLPHSVKFLDSAASSAAKARGVKPIWSTTDPLDVATALKCINAYQIRVNVEDLEALDEEKNAKPLIAAARILQSTSQHLRSAENPSNSSDINDMSLYSALAFAMHGNFPSASAALLDISSDFVQSSLMIQMVIAICNPCDKSVRFRSTDTGFEPFRRSWYIALRNSDSEIRERRFNHALKLLSEKARAGTMADGALFMGARMAAHQARRLATVNLLEEAPEIPNWFIENSLKSGMVTLLPPQQMLLSKRRIAKHGRNTLLTLPTSTGKTFVAEACLASALNGDGLCVYVAPYVAVGEQVKDSLRKRFANEIPIVPMFGGFRTAGKNNFNQKEIFVVTPERFDGWLRSGENIERLCTVVFDEIHILENGVRGARVEGLLSRLRLLQRTNLRLRIIGLSAVLTEPELVCKWLGVQDNDLHQIGWRPTARRLAMCLANGDMYWIHGNDALRPKSEKVTSSMSELVKIHLPGVIRPAPFANANEKSAATNVGFIVRDLLNRLGSPGLVVCPRRLDTRLLARELMNDQDYIESKEIFHAAKEILERYPYLDLLAECLKRGIAYHNASLPFDVRRVIELLTRKRALSVVCATTTLAEGADLPFRWTIVAHWLSSMHGEGKLMKSMTFRNIAGRCGRAGAFSEGDTILFQNLMGPPSRIRSQQSKHHLEKVMFSSSPLMSTLGGEWNEATPQEQQLLEATFSAQLLACIAEHPQSENIVGELADASYAGQTDGDNNIQRILSDTLISILDDNQAGGAMAVMNSPIRLTEFGHAANLSGFSPITCRLMFKYLSGDNFKSGGELYSDILKQFNGVPEQSNEKLIKIFSGSLHKNVVREDNLDDVLKGLLLRKDLRTIFESLRKENSKAKPETVETMFEEFVSLLNSVVGNFLPWILRGLEKFSKYGSEVAAAISWSNMAEEIEAALGATGGETAADYSLLQNE